MRIISTNENLSKARKEKNDEFYTQLSDIENELKYYELHFKDKVVYCNCDNPEYSNFWKYFSLNFEKLKLKRLISTYYSAEKPSYMLEMWRDESGVHSSIKTLKQNGDFRSPESIELLKQSDIVVTNPPFSLFREYVGQLMEYNKKFVILGNINAVTYKEIFPLIKDNKIWSGFSFNKTMEFIMPDDYVLKGKAYIDENGKKHGFVPAIAWFTNLDINKRHEDLILYKTYADDPSKYPRYDNYDAINVDKVTDIPIDYVPCWFDCDFAETCPYALSEGKCDAMALCENQCNGEMGVPITFMDKYNPDQFEILGHEHDIDGNGGDGVSGGQFEIIANGGSYKGEGSIADELFITCSDDTFKKKRKVYKRIIVRRKKA